MSVKKIEERHVYSDEGHLYMERQILSQAHNDRGELLGRLNGIKSILDEWPDSFAPDPVPLNVAELIEAIREEMK
jgi:hypothetical protein